MLQVLGKTCLKYLIFVCMIAQAFESKLTVITLAETLGFWPWYLIKINPQFYPLRPLECLKEIELQVGIL